MAELKSIKQLGSQMIMETITNITLIHLLVNTKQINKECAHVMQAQQDRIDIITKEHLPY